MKPYEILCALPQWADASPDSLLDSPAFSMPCRLGDETVEIRRADVIPAISGTIALSVAFGDEPHTLLLARSGRFPELDRLWDSRGDVPAPVLLALVEKECGAFFQMLENAVRRQLRLAGLAAPVDAAGIAFFKMGPVSFGLTRSAAVVSAFGTLRNLDLAHESVRSRLLAAETEYASFALPGGDKASLAPGDALLLPEIGASETRLVVDGRFTVSSAGVAPFKDDGRLRVVAAESREITLGGLFDRAADPAEEKAQIPAQLRLCEMGKTVAYGSFGRLAGQNAFFVEALA